MDQAVAYSTLGLTVSLAVFRPRLGSFRFTPGLAAIVGVLTLFATRLLSTDQLIAAAALQWRPLVTLTSIMVITGVVQEVGAVDRLVAWIEHRARARAAVHTFGVVFAISVIAPALLNNDAAILMLTPIVVALTRRLYPGQPALTVAFAFAVFLAPGVAPFIVSNPMNLIVAERAGLDFNSYAVIMLPISIVGAALTYAILRVVYRRALVGATLAPPAPLTTVHRHAAERPAVGLMLAVFFAYPIAAAYDVSIWAVAVAGALAALAICRLYRVAPLRKATSHVSIDILVFLWGIFLVVKGLGAVGVVEGLRALYATAGSGSGRELATVGVASAIGSALIDNHPMSLLNLDAIGAAHARLLQAALVGGDIGPRLLPIGSLAGLLWMDLLRRAGVEIGVRRFVRIGTLVLLPTMAVSLAMLWLL